METQQHQADNGTIARMMETAAVTPAVPVYLPTPGAFDLSPRSLTEAMELANMLAKSTIVPKDFVDKPGNVLVAIQWGMELGLKPMQAMQNIAVINGRPSLWGDAVIAIVRASPLCEYIRESYDEVTFVATCRAKRRGDPETVRTFSRAEALKASLLNKDIWKQYEKRMTQMRARSWCLRDTFPDVLRGMPIAEEVMDTLRDVTAESTVERAAAPAGNTKTSALKERLRIVNFDDVIKAFTEAFDSRTLDLAIEKAKGLKDADQREKANNAYHAAKERLRKAEQTSSAQVLPTDDEVVTKLAAAKSVDDVQLVVDLLRPIQTIDEARYAILYQRCVDRTAELEPK